VPLGKRAVAREELTHAGGFGGSGHWGSLIVPGGEGWVHRGKRKEPTFTAETERTAGKSAGLGPNPWNAAAKFQHALTKG
jgi:hypothetical protein